MSSSEKITGVKNSQAEKMLGRMVQQFHSELRQRDRLLQSECFKLQYDKKLMGLDRKKSDLEARRRLDPAGDHSHTEREVASIEKYCTKSSEIMPYTDKSLKYKVRTQSLPEAETPIVAKARGTLRQKDTNAALEKKKAQMYDFLNKPKHTATGQRTHHNERDTDTALPHFSSRKGPKGEGAAASAAPGGKTVSLSLPAMTMTPGMAKRAQTTGAGSMVQKLMCRNPVIKEAIEQQHHRPSTHGPGERPPPEELVKRQRPLTHSVMRGMRREVQKQVNAFCARVENEIIDIKTEAFNRSIDFKADRNSVYREFNEEMKRYKKQEEFKDKDRLEREEEAEKSEQLRQAEARNFLLRLTATEKDRLIMTNIGRLSQGERRRRDSESKPMRGIPHMAQARSQRHTPTAKLQRMLEAMNRPTNPAAMGSNKKGPPPQVVV